MKKSIALLLILAFMFSITACSGGQDAEDTSAPTSATPTSPGTQAATQQPTEAVPSMYPLADETYTLTALGVLDSSVEQYITDFNSQPYLIAAEAATNVYVEWTMLSTLAARDQYPLLAVSGETLPDLIMNIETNYKSGINDVIGDDLCIDLVPYLEEYAPDFYAVLKEYPEFAKGKMSADGELVTMWNFQNDPGNVALIRKDWLDKVGMDVPTTYDELTEVLTAFHVQLDVPIPIEIGGTGAPLADALGSSLLTGGYGVSNPYYTTYALPWQVDENGVVSMSYTLEGYYEYFIMANEWYENGLIEGDFFTRTNKGMFDNKMLAGELGMIYNAATSLNDSYAASAADADFELVAMADMTKTGTETIRIGGLSPIYGTGGMSVSSACENVELAVSYLNWFWTEEGEFVSNFGFQGETFEYDSNGDIRFTDIILNNPEGLSSKTAHSVYVSSARIGYKTLTERYTAAFTNEKEKGAWEIWSSNRVQDGLYFGLMTPEETELYNQYAADVSTFIMAKNLGYILGEEPLENYWDNIDKLYEIGLQKVIDIKQAAYDRFMSMDIG